METIRTTSIYPSNWRKVSAIIRRLAGGHCQRCGCETSHLSVHHIGTPLATGDGWRPGSPKDKHDLRQENLIPLCETCHSTLEPARVVIQAIRARKQRKRRAKLAQHRALGIGTGLVVYAEGQVA